jgi:hypothetical protein
MKARQDATSITSVPRRQLSPVHCCVIAGAARCALIRPETEIDDHPVIVRGEPLLESDAVMRALHR